MKIKTLFYLAATILLTLGLFASTSLAQARQVGQQGSIERANSQRTVSVEVENEIFRRELKNFYSEAVLTLKIFNEYQVTRAIVNKASQPGAGIVERILAEQDRITTMSGTEIMILRSSSANADVLREAASNLHSIRTNGQLRDSLSAADRAEEWIKSTRKSNDGSGNINVTSGTTVITPDVCPDPSAVPSVTDIAVLAGVTAAAQGVMEALPTDFVSILARVAFVALFTAAQVAQIAIQAVYDIDQNCKADIFEGKVLAAFDLQLRLKIEANLAGLGLPVLLFYIPTAQGGHLTLTRSIVADSIAKATTAGVPVDQANAYLGVADTLIGAGQYKDAYNMLRLAYQQIVQ
ncbi:MAG: hypothetical protein IPG76_15380 [Acidobacteria bacterium]|nr:hypothetical protein [Acidobacteriota bacterium]